MNLLKEFLPRLANVTLILELAILLLMPSAVFSLGSKEMPIGKAFEGRVLSSVITIGPFDLHRRYRSMEGPFSLFSVKPGDLVASRRIEIPESMINFLERGKAAPGMMDCSIPKEANANVQGLIDTIDKPRTLLWLKAVKVEVLDEHDRVLPTAEFICHFNIDTNAKFHNKLFWQAEPCVTNRVITLTQGQTELKFPEGYAVPVASDEPWSVIFQAANRTTNKHRRVKHRCTVYFIKDSDLHQPMTALNWFAPFVYVNLESNPAHVTQKASINCLPFSDTSFGVNAPNNTCGTFIDHTGHRMSGHWIIPPGNNTYVTPIDDDRNPEFATKPRVLHAVWTHVHPLCTSVTLYRRQAHSRTKVFTINANTKTEHGLELTNIDYWKSKEGILLAANCAYELETTYKNNTGAPQDAMASTGMFFADSMFVKPKWALPDEIDKKKPTATVGAKKAQTIKNATK
jgi:hypothetical protein